MKTVCLSVRVPKEMFQCLEKAKRTVGATSYSELLRDAIRHYLSELSFMSERATEAVHGFCDAANA